MRVQAQPCDRNASCHHSLRLALEGVGLAIVNPLAIDGFAQRGLIFRPFEPSVYFKSYLLFRPDMQKASLVRAFVAALMAVRNTR